jgi:hypothetical protein
MPVNGEEETIDQGATGEPEPAAVGSGDESVLASSDGGADGQPAPGDDADFLKRLESYDPEKLPESIRRKLEAPFLSNMNKKTTEFDVREKTYLAALERLARNPNTEAPQANVKEELRERARAGDVDAIEALIAATVEERTGPQMELLSKQNAISEAARLMPALPQYESQVAAALQEDPVLMRMVSQNGYAYASRVLAGLAYQIDAQKKGEEIKQLSQSFDKRVAKAVDDYKRKLQGLPPSTSQAGKSPTATPTVDAPSLRDALEEAYKESGMAS